MEDRQSELDAFHRELFPHEQQSAAQPGTLPTQTDEEVIALCRRAENRDKFSMLFDKGRHWEKINESELDAALFGILKFYTRDAAQIERIMRRSALRPHSRGKWDEKRGGESFLAYDIRRLLDKCKNDPVYQGSWASRAQRALEDTSNPETDAAFIAARAGSVNGTPKPNAAPPEDLPHNDLGNARRFAALWRGKVFFCPELDQWFIWNGSRWRADKANQILGCAMRVSVSIYTEAERLLERSKVNGDVPPDIREQANQLVAWAVTSGNGQRIREMLTLAAALPGMFYHPEELDAHPWRLNCLNGIIDLTTGTLDPHDPREQHTLQCPVEYDPDARSEEWERFIHETCGGDSEKCQFFQRCFGYSISGVTDEDLVFYIHGRPNSGKSTSVLALRAALGDYARPTDFEAFAKKKGDIGNRPEIAQLVGARFVPSVEVESGRELATALVSSLSGGEELQVSAKYRDPMTFAPTFKLWIVANEDFTISSSNNGMKRRLIKIEFDSVPEKPDVHLRTRLMDASVSGAAVLAWAVRGCLEWQHLRERRIPKLGIPRSIELVTEEYFLEQDPVADFISDWIDAGPHETHRAPTKDIWDAFGLWCDKEGRKKLASSSVLGSSIVRKITEVKVEKNKQIKFGDGENKKNQRGFLGIALKDEARAYLLAARAKSKPEF